MGWTLAAVLAVNLAALAASWFLLRGWIARRLSAPRQAADLGEEVGRLVTELNQAAERNVVLLEDRVAALNELLATADKKIGLLRREIERHEAGARVYGHLATPSARAAAADAASDPLRPAVRAPMRGAGVEAGRAPASGMPPAGGMPSAGGMPAGPTSTTPAEHGATGAVAQDPRTAMRAEIRRLAMTGLTPAAIAARVGAPLGEIELIVSLELHARGS